MNDNKFWDEFHSKHHSPVPSIEDLGVLHYLSSTDKILEIGFGGGQNLLALNARGFRSLHGVEISAHAAHQLKTKCVEIDIKMIDGRSLPYCDDYFDAIIISAVLSTIGNFDVRDRMLMDIERVTGPRGVIILCDYIFDVKKRTDYNSNLAAYNFIGKFKPTWSEIPFVHYTTDGIIDLFRPFNVLLKTNIFLPTLRNEEEAGILLVLSKN